MIILFIALAIILAYKGTKKKWNEQISMYFLHFCYIIIRTIPAAIAPNIPIIYIVPLKVEGLVMGK